MFTVNVVAPYTDIYTKKCRQISSAGLPERHVCVPKQSYIDFGDNFNFGKLVVGKLDCRRVGLSASVQLPAEAAIAKIVVIHMGVYAHPHQILVWHINSNSDPNLYP